MKYSDEDSRRDQRSEGDRSSGTEGESSPRVGGDASAANRTRSAPTDAAEALGELARIVDSTIPAGYRREAFRALARWRLALAEAAPARSNRGMPPGAPAGGTAPGYGAGIPGPGGRLALGTYEGILAAPGRMLMKALVALEVSSAQLGIGWLTPAEIERFLVERARVRSAYRTNLSNALSGARQLVDRRKRGRGYEYRLTENGRLALERELRIEGSI